MDHKIFFEHFFKIRYMIHLDDTIFILKGFNMILYICSDVY